MQLNRSIRNIPHPSRHSKKISESEDVWQARLNHVSAESKKAGFDIFEICFQFGTAPERSMVGTLASGFDSSENCPPLFRGVFIDRLRRFCRDGQDLPGRAGDSDREGFERHCLPVSNDTTLLTVFWTLAKSIH